MASIKQNISILIDDRDVLLADTDKYDDPRPNRLEIPIGAGASHGWFLMLKSDADAVREAGTVDVTFKQSNTIGDITETVLRNMIVKSVEDFGIGGFDADTQVAIVEITDVRWIWQRRSSLQNEFNVPLRGGDVDPGAAGTDSGEGYKESSLDGGEQYTWEEMLEVIWATLTPEYGPWPGTFTGSGTAPLSTPYDWKFQGVNAWQALITVLARIGKVIVYDPVSENSPFAIYDAGSTSPATTAAGNALGPPLNEQFGAPSLNSGIPAEMTVYFPSQDMSSDADDEELYVKRWDSADGSGASITRAIAQGGGGVLNLWCDLPLLTNDAGEQNTAQIEVAADEMLIGFADDLAIVQNRKRFAGFAYVPLDATIKSFVFTYRVSLLSETGGAFSSLAAHPGEPTVGLYSRQRFLWWIDRMSPPSVQQYLKPSLPRVFGNIIFGKTVGPIDKGSSGQINIWTGPAGSETVSDPLETLNPHNHFADLDADKACIVVRDAYKIDGDLLIAGEC